MGNSVFLLEKSPYDDGGRGPPLLRFPPSSERNFCQETQRGHQEGPSQGQKTGDECHECELGGPLPDLEGGYALGPFQEGLSPETYVIVLYAGVINVLSSSCLEVMSFLKSLSTMPPWNSPSTTQLTSGTMGEFLARASPVGPK